MGYPTDPEHAIAVGRPADLAIRAEGHKLRLQREGDGYRLVSDETGTLVAAEWATAEGYGLTLDEIEEALNRLGGP